MSKKPRKRTAKRNRSRSTIDMLPPTTKDTVEQMIVGKATYKEIVAYLQTQGVALSQDAVSRYARRYMETIEELHAAQETFRSIVEEVDKYPELDTTEVLLRLSSHKLLSAIVNIQDDAIKQVEPAEVISSINALARAISYKKQVDLKGKTEVEKAVDAYRALLFGTISRKRPELYKELLDILNEEQTLLQGTLDTEEGTE